MPVILRWLVCIAIATVLLGLRAAHAHDCSSEDDCAQVVTNAGWLSAVLAAFLAWLGARKVRPKENKDDDPAIVVTPDGATVCPQEEIVLVATATPADAVVNWQAPDGSPAQGTGPKFVVRFPLDGGHQIIAVATTPAGREATAFATVRVRRSSGAAWANDFPASNQMAALHPTFGGNLQRFLDAVRASGVQPTVITTFRPSERAYLMHVAYRLTRPVGNIHRIDPENAPSHANVDICWVHRDANGVVDDAASRAAAEALRAQLGVDNTLLVPPALNTRHAIRRAADVRIVWTGNLTIQDSSGNPVVITSGPRTSENPDLINVAQTYNVVHFVNAHADVNHWSDTGG